MKTENQLSNPAIEPQFPAPIPYTLRIGVTGHRNLPDPIAVNTAVERTLEFIRKTLSDAILDPHQPLTIGQTSWRRMESYIVWKAKRALASVHVLQPETPADHRTVLNWHVVSSLAKGADRIGARVAINQLGASLETILPFSVEDYKKDFNTTEEDLPEFEELYKKTVNKTLHAFEMEPAPDKRADGYRRAGEKMVESCEILIAIWDGEPAHGPGGTAEIIEYALSINRLVVWINSKDPKLPAKLVSSVRNKDKSWYVSSHSLPRIAAGFSPQFVQLIAYNYDPAFNSVGFKRAYISNWNRLENARYDSRLPEIILHPILKVLWPHYAMADHLAIHYQKLYTRAAIWLYRLAAIAVAIAVIQALYIPSHNRWIIFEIVALVSAVVLFRLSLCENWHEKWLNYRHLAERMRILTFSCLIKSDTLIKTTGKNQTLPFYPGPGGWVLEAFDYVNHLLPEFQLSDNDLPAVKNFVLKGLIKDQAEFHAKSAVKKASRALKDNQFIGIMLGITLVAAILHMFNLWNINWLVNFVIALVVILPALAASQHAIGGIHDFERIAARYARMAEILHRFERTIGDATTKETMYREISNAEEIMSIENHEWCVSLSFRHIDLPV